MVRARSLAVGRYRVPPGHASVEPLDGPTARTHRAAVVALAVVLAVLLAAPSIGVAPSADAAPPVVPVTGGTLPGVAFYPRALVLAHAGGANGGVLATTNDGVTGTIWRSTDHGASFSALSTIPRPPGTTFLCCIALFELPVALGPFPAGTLLWAGSLMTTQGLPRHMDLRVWRSDDHGLTWAPMSSCATSTNGGLWEPDFHVANDGRLVCMFSDETDQPAHSQVLAQTVSSDGGQTWGPKIPVVASDAAGARPGMVTVARLPDTSWVMTYELCAVSPNCAVRLRRSDDGLDWGPPDAEGVRVFDAAGGYFAHTPVISWSPAGGPSGTLILSGQILFDAANKVAPGNGHTVFLNDHGGDGSWTSIDAPVAVPKPYDNFCPNYSSPVIDLDGTGLLLELASSWQGPDCVTSFGTSRVDLRSTPITSTTTSPSPSTTAASVATTAISSSAAPAPAAPAAPVGAPPLFAG